MDDRKILVLTGASRGIGHATVKRFSIAGWRVITCSRHGFPENCPWEAGPEDHLQIDLSSPEDVSRGAAELLARLDGKPLHALVNNAAISPKTPDGSRLDCYKTSLDLWQHVYQVNVFAPIILAQKLCESLGAGALTTFRKVQMPLIVPGVISGGLFAFITSFDEVVAVLFLASPEQRTIPRQMWSGIREQISPTILAVATLLVLLSIILLTVLELLRRRSERLRGITSS